jgi:hypothetical protein
LLDLPRTRWRYGATTDGAQEADAAETTLRQRAETLPVAARVTARTLTKLRLNSRYPPEKPTLR